MRLRRSLTVVPIVAAFFVNAFVPHAQASNVTVVVTFDASKGELPEGLTIDKRGDFYVSLISPVSEIRKITPEGSQSVVADLGFGGFGPLGLATDARGRLYVCASTFDPATRGIYRISGNGDATRLPGTGSILFPNGLAFDKRGDLFVADSIGGAVWRIPRGGSAELWVQDPLLQGNGAFGLGFPLGANGIAFRHGSFIVTNTEVGSLVMIPERPDGDAGTPTTLISDAALFGADGLAIDVHGGIDVAVLAQSTIVHVADAAVTTIANSSDGINEASSLAFGTGLGERKSLFAVNFGPFSPAPTPSLLRIPVGIPGQPLP